ncbi:B2 bradykinin receptor-like isoform X1 [Lates japonicus]|uniref:B1 bradykinin receptor n=1 Tax=Lates japonicus TaxID=270547 RepID=A0AAD3NJK1_LATJO|nr:B2 bradykinin receptor-like isoform X1 [Lates japonicus]
MFQIVLRNQGGTYTVLQIYILVIAVLGIVFNVFVLMVFCLHKKAYTVADIYLGNLIAKTLSWSPVCPSGLIPTTFSPVATHGDQNSTNVTHCLKETKEWTYTVVPIYVLVISVLGIIFNVFVLMVFCLHKKACTVAEIYLSNLAAADLVLVSCLPFWAVYAARKFNWPFGGSLCKLVNLSINMNVYCSIYFLVLVSIDRYMALVHPLSHERLRRPKFAKLGCLLVWALGLLLSVPTLIYREVKYFSGINTTLCYLNYPNTTVQLLSEGMLTMLSVIIPISIISFCTFKIIQALNNRLMKSSNSQKKEQKATTLVLAVLVAFLICWVPFHLVKIIEWLIRAEVLRGCKLSTVIDICKQFFIYLAFFNSVLNPILYVIVGEKLQEKS